MMMEDVGVWTVSTRVKSTQTGTRWMNPSVSSATQGKAPPNCTRTRSRHVSVAPLGGGSVVVKEVVPAPSRTLPCNTSVSSSRTSNHSTT